MSIQNNCTLLLYISLVLVTAGYSVSCLTGPFRLLALGLTTVLALASYVVGTPKRS
jgi:hypothetical protein